MRNEFHLNVELNTLAALAKEVADAVEDYGGLIDNGAVAGRLEKIEQKAKEIKDRIVEIWDLKRQKS